MVAKRKKRKRKKKRRRSIARGIGRALRRELLGGRGPGTGDDLGREVWSIGETVIDVITKDAIDMTGIMKEKTETAGKHLVIAIAITNVGKLLVIVIVIAGKRLATTDLIRKTSVLTCLYTETVSVKSNKLRISARGKHQSLR